MLQWLSPAPPTKTNFATAHTASNLSNWPSCIGIKTNFGFMVANYHLDASFFRTRTPLIPNTDSFEAFAVYFTYSLNFECFSCVFCVNAPALSSISPVKATCAPCSHWVVTSRGRNFHAISFTYFVDAYADYSLGRFRIIDSISDSYKRLVDNALGLASCSGWAY